MLERFPELEPGDIVSTSMGAPGEDVQLSPAARKILPIAIETKARRSIAVGRFYEQAQEHAIDCKDYVDPVLVIKEDRKSPLVVISLDYYMALVYNQHLYKKAFLQQEQAISKQALKEKRNANPT